MKNHALKNDIKTIEQALSYISAHDRDVWVTMAMAIKSELGDSGFEVWNSWSQTSNNYNKQDALNTWKSISPDGAVHIGTLYHVAKEHGFVFNDVKCSDYRLRERPLKDSLIAPTEENKKIEEAEKQALKIFNNSKPCNSHKYLTKKRIKPPHHARLNLAESSECSEQFWTKGNDNKLIKLQGNLLILPLMDIKAVIRGILAIDEEGRKSYQKGIKKSGLFTPVTNGHTTPWDYVGNIYVGEGIATMATIQEMTGCLSIMATDAGNLPHVSQAIRNKFSKSKIIITGDWDTSGTGQKKAIEAARLVNGYVVFPKFIKEHANSKKPPSDFNDVFVLYGEEVAKQQLEQIQEPNLNDEWPEPQPILEPYLTKDYPIDELPDGIREAVKEVTSSVQCPVALTASSAITAISLAAQGLADVRRDIGLEGPISIYTITIAESGERKTAVDKKFSSPILKWEEEQRQKLKETLTEYRAMLKAWEAEKEGILSKIKSEAKKGSIKEELRKRLIEIEKSKPKKFSTPRLLYGDATPEALAWGLSLGWHSGGILSNEAGIVFGSHGMSRDSIMRNLSQLNVLWDGGVLKIDRRTSDSFEVKGARLTIGLAVQADTIRSFFESSQGLARGIGFLARFLIANPTSTQGYRPYKESSNDGRFLTAFQNRIMQILDKKLNLNEEGEIIPEIIEFSSEAKEAWIKFYNDVEAELKPGGDMADAKDVASKIAENAARVAACFHIYCDDGLDKTISKDLMIRACKIAGWHLYEGRKFLKEIATPVEISNSIKLDSWLIGYCNKNKLNVLSTREIQRRGPVRNKAQMLEAIDVLMDADRAKLVIEGKKKNIFINPKLLGE